MPLRVKVPDSCVDLDPARVVRALERSFGQIPPAARELGVPIPDLQRLTWAQPKLLEEALEEHELAVLRAQGVVIQALDSPDWRRRAWACDKIMSSWLARDHPLAPVRRRSAAIDVSVQSKKIVDYTFCWRNSDDDLRDAEAAECERLRDEGRLIELEAGPERSSKD